MTGSSYGDGGGHAHQASRAGQAPWERRYRWQPPAPPAPPLPQYARPVRIPPRHAQPPAQAPVAPPPPPPTQAAPAGGPDDSGQSANRKLLAASGSIAIATLTSRLTGFAKQLVLLVVLGGAITSSFTIAIQIPNMISEFVLGAVLTAIVVPVLVRAEREDPDGGAAFVRRLFTMALVLLGSAALLATAAAPLLIEYVFLPQDGKVSGPLTTALAIMLLPAILFFGLTALLTAVLNTRQVFKPGAWAPVVNNVIVLAVLAIYVLLPGEISLDPVRMGDPKLLLLGLGVTFGVVAQVLTLVPAIRRQGIDLRPLWGLDDRLKQFGGMAVAIMLYVLISQVGLVFGNRISADADAAGPAIYTNAWALLQMPYGILGVTLLTAIMPRLSRNAAAENTPAVVDDLGVATRLTMLGLFPVVSFLTFAGPLVGQALYGYGNFGGDAELLGEAVRWSAFTLIPYSLVLIHLRVFYAREQAWTPTWIVLGITGVKIALSALAPVVASSDEHVVSLLGAATGVSYAVGACIGGFLLHRSLGDLKMANVGSTVWKVALASLAGGIVMAIVDRVLNLDNLTNSMGGLGSIIRVSFDGVVMLTLTFALLWMAKIPEIVAVTVAINRRLRGTPREEPEPEPEPMPSYDPMWDANTMVLPVIRADDVGGTGIGQFPYPVRQRSGGRAAMAPSWQSAGREGVRVSDDLNAGRPTGGSTVGSSPVTQKTNSGGVTVSSNPNAGRDDRGARPGPDGKPSDASRTPVDKTTADTDATQGGRVPPPPASSPQHDDAARRNPRGPKLIPGASVAGGRYRLLAPHGGARGLKFWQALDTKLDREVALTFVDSEQKAGAGEGHNGPQAILSRTLRLGRVNSPGLARVLDVVRGSSGGIVVAEWTPGRSLREMAETKPSPIGAARAIGALASAAELTHRGGGALSIDHPDRIRISVGGNAVLAFPGTLGDADAQGDVRGLGAMLYALMTARWPIGNPTGVSGTAAPGTTVGGLKLAEHGPDGAPVEPRKLRPEVPFEISAVAVRALETNRGVRTAATVQHVLEQASVVDQKTDLMPALRLGQRAPGARGHALADPEAVAAEQAKSNRMMLILAGLGGLTVIVLGLIGWWLANFLAGGSSNEPLNDQDFGLTTSAAAPEAPASVAVKPSEVQVFSPQGTPDGVGTVDLVLDNNPATLWKSDTYNQPFPSLKNGLGILATLPDASKLTNVWINSPSPGTKVEIRTAPNDGPTLDQTQVIGEATLGEGVTEIPVAADQPSKFVLVWITDLGKAANNQNQTSIADLGFTATP